MKECASFWWNNRNRVIIAGKSADLEASRHDVHWSLMMLELWLEHHVDSRGFDNSPARP